MNSLSTRIGSAIALVAIAGSAVAGPLTPPAGPAASTYKTLGEVEPRTPVGPDTTPGDADSLFRISQPGSYYLTGNISGVSGKTGIEIAADGVTLDLNGFTMDGFKLIGLPATLRGIQVEGDHRNIIIRNGSVRRWGGNGISTPTTTSAHLEDLVVDGCGGNGFRVGSSTAIRRCTADFNSLAGFAVAGTGSVLRECSANGNTFQGIALFNPGSSVLDCVASANGSHGISIVDHCRVRFCQSHGNGVGPDSGAGVNISGGGGSVTDCIITQNDLGVRVTVTGSLIADNIITNNPEGVHQFPPSTPRFGWGGGESLTFSAWYEAYSNPNFIDGIE